MSEVDCFEDLEVDHSVLEEADLGFRFDRRMMTRSSAPELWSDSSDSLLPDCAALVRRAARAQDMGDNEAYEKYMHELVRFFGNYAPARTPDQVRRAFRLGTPSKKDLANQRNVQQQMPFLDAATTQHICSAPIDVSRIDALVQADKERERFRNNNNKTK